MSPVSSGRAGAAALTAGLTAANSPAGAVVRATQATLLSASGQISLYSGSAVRVSPGTYVVVAEIPAYSAPNAVASETLVYRRLAIRVRTAYLSFGYLSISQSAAGASYYLIGSASGGIPSRLSFSQGAGGLARMTMSLRSGVYGSSALDWGIQSGSASSFCGGGQNQEVQQPARWVNYLTPGTWTTSVQSSSLGTDGNLHRTAYSTIVRTYRAHTSSADVFGGAVASPLMSFPARASAQFEYGPSLFDTAGTTSSGAVCCMAYSATLRVGGTLVKRQKFSSSCQSCFRATLRRSGWYTLAVAGRRWFPGGNTPADPLSPRADVSFRFRASPATAGNGAWQNLPVTLAELDPGGLSLANQAPPGGATSVTLRIVRPPNAGVRSPVYPIMSVRVLASVNGGATWKQLSVRRSGDRWRLSVPDPASGYVALRTVVSDSPGDRTQQTIYRAYGVS